MQTVVKKELPLYTLWMLNAVEEKTQQELLRYIARRGQGAIKDVAKAVPCHRNTIKNVMNGARPTQRVLSGIQKFLADQKQAGVTGVSDKEAESFLIGELRSLADYLASPAFDQDSKVERFFKRVNEWLATEKSIRAALGKNSQHGEGTNRIIHGAPPGEQ